MLDAQSPFAMKFSHHIIMLIAFNFKHHCETAWSRRIKCYFCHNFFFIERDRENVGYNFSYLNSPLIICFFSHINPFMIVGIHTRALLIIWAKEISTCSLVYISPIVQEKLDHCWILIHNGYVQNALPCVKNKTTPM